MAYIDTPRSAAFAQALGPIRPSTGFFARIKAAFETAQRRRTLRNMSPHLLRDVGMNDADIAYLKSHTSLGIPHTLDLHQIR